MFTRARRPEFIIPNAAFGIVQQIPLKKTG